MRLGVALIGILAPGVAAAAPRDEVVTVPAGGAAPAVLYLDRCPDDCAISPGTDDARTDTSAAVAAPATLTRLPRLDLVWADVVICVQEALTPYAIEVAIVEPAADVAYAEVKIAGSPEELGRAPGTLAVAPRAADCAPLTRGVAFVFGNVYDLVAEPERAAALCASAVHAAGHLLGLDHVDDCDDAMAWRDDCPGRAWFADLDAPCADAAGPRPCACGGDAQRSHAHLAAALGPGRDPPPPRVTITAPADGGAVGAPFDVTAEVGAGRPIDRVELRVGGEIADVVGDAGTVTLTGEVVAGGDVEVRAYDDRGRAGADRISVTARPGDGGCSSGGGAHPGLAVALAALARGWSRRRRWPAAASSSHPCVASRTLSDVELCRSSQPSGDATAYTTAPSSSMATATPFV